MASAEKLLQWPEKVLQRFFVVGLPARLELSDALSYLAKVQEEPGQVVTFSPEVLYSYTPKGVENSSDLNDQFLCSFCFPIGVGLEIVEFEHTEESLSYLEKQTLSGAPPASVFMLKADRTSTFPLYGVCCYVKDFLPRLPCFCQYGDQSQSRPPQSNPKYVQEAVKALMEQQVMVQSTRCYCMLSHYPFFDMHIEVLTMLIRLDQQQQLRDIRAITKELRSMVGPADLAQAGPQLPPLGVLNTARNGLTAWFRALSKFGKMPTFNGLSADALPEELRGELASKSAPPRIGGDADEASQPGEGNGPEPLPLASAPPAGSAASGAAAELPESSAVDNSDANSVSSSSSGKSGKRKAVSFALPGDAEGETARPHMSVQVPGHGQDDSDHSKCKRANSLSSMEASLDLTGPLGRASRVASFKVLRRAGSSGSYDGTLSATSSIQTPDSDSARASPTIPPWGQASAPAAAAVPPAGPSSSYVPAAAAVAANGPSPFLSHTHHLTIIEEGLEADAGASSPTREDIMAVRAAVSTMEDESPFAAYLMHSADLGVAGMQTDITGNLDKKTVSAPVMGTPLSEPVPPELAAMPVGSSSTQQERVSRLWKLAAMRARTYAMHRKLAGAGRPPGVPIDGQGGEGNEFGDDISAAASSMEAGNPYVLEFLRYLQAGWQGDPDKKSEMESIWGSNTIRKVEQDVRVPDTSSTPPPPLHVTYSTPNTQRARPTMPVRQTSLNHSNMADLRAKLARDLLAIDDTTDDSEAPHDSTSRTITQMLAISSRPMGRSLTRGRSMRQRSGEEAAAAPSGAPLAAAPSVVEIVDLTAPRRAVGGMESLLAASGGSAGSLPGAIIVHDRDMVEQAVNVLNQRTFESGSMDKQASDTMSDALTWAGRQGSAQSSLSLDSVASQSDIHQTSEHDPLPRRVVHVLDTYSRVEAREMYPFSVTLFKPDVDLPLIRYGRPINPCTRRQQTFPVMAPDHIVLQYAEEEMIEACKLWSIAALCRCMSLSNILTYMTAVALEMRTVVLCPNLSLLSAAVLATGPLISPLMWQTPLFLPITPLLEMQWVEGAQPFVLGAQLAQACVPFVLGFPCSSVETLLRDRHRELRDMSRDWVVVHVLDDEVLLNEVQMGTLPGRDRLAADLKAVYNDLRSGRAKRPDLPVYEMTNHERYAAIEMLRIIEQYWTNLLEQIRSGTITAALSRTWFGRTTSSEFVDGMRRTMMFACYEESLEQPA